MLKKEHKNFLETIIDEIFVLLFKTIDSEKIEVLNFLENKEKFLYKLITFFKYFIFISHVILMWIPIILIGNEPLLKQDPIVIIVFILWWTILIIFLILKQIYIIRGLHNYTFGEYRKRKNALIKYFNRLRLILINRFLIVEKEVLIKINLKLEEFQQELNYFSNILKSKILNIERYKIIPIFSIILTVILYILSITLPNIIITTRLLITIFEIIFSTISIIFLLFFDYVTPKKIFRFSYDKYTNKELLSFESPTKKKFEIYYKILRVLLHIMLFSGPSKEKKLDKLIKAYNNTKETYNQKINLYLK